MAPPLNARPGTIIAARLLLVPLTERDAQEMVQVLADESLYEFTGGRPPMLEELQARYRRWAGGGSDDGKERWHNFVMRTKQGQSAVGTVQATVVEHGAVAEVAWIVGAPWQGNGYASEAAAALVEWLAQGGVRSVLAHVHPAHVASAEVAKRAGLAPTGEWSEGERVWRGPVTST